MSFERELALLSLSCFVGLGCGAPAPGGSAAPASSGSSPREEASGASPASSVPPRSSARGPDTAAAGGVFDGGSAGFLSSIPTRVSDRAKAWVEKSASDEDFARGLRVRLQVMRGYKNIGELSRRSKLPLVNGTFQISDVSRLGSRDAPTKGDRASSFVIDYDEESVALPAGELERAGTERTPSAIASFVGRYITEKSYARSFDVASRVAATRSGDCSEHAVLTAALLRRFGFGARVILGVVLLGVTGDKTPSDVKAFGHAWVEHYADGRWRIVDAALGGPECATAARSQAECGMPAGMTRRLAYLPISAMKDESVSFHRALIDQPGVESILKVEIDVAAGG